jgi:hypothetical protein
MYERVRFEFNLPSTARQYLEETAENYPAKSLPGYPNFQPKGENAAALMPRLIYDIWPFYVPDYTLTSLVGGTTNTRVSVQQQPATTTYHRQLKLKHSNVDAESMNRSVIDSMLTPDELDRKIREQIYNNRHLLEMRPASALGPATTTTTTVHHVHHKSPRSPSRETHSVESCHCNCGRSRTGGLGESVKIVHDGHQQHHSSESDNRFTNKFYEAYRNNIQELYHDCAHSRSHSPANMLRSKSVTFIDSENHDHSHSHHHHHGHPHYESVYYETTPRKEIIKKSVKSKKLGNKSSK